MDAMRGGNELFPNYFGEKLLTSSTVSCTLSIQPLYFGNEHSTRA